MFVAFVWHQTEMLQDKYKVHQQEGCEDVQVCLGAAGTSWRVHFKSLSYSVTNTGAAINPQGINTYCTCGPTVTEPGD